MSEFQQNTNTKIVMLDNLDSFTYNLVDEFQSLGFEPVVYRNTLSADFILEQIDKLKHSANQSPNQEVLLVLSPGPGEPSNAGCLMELIQRSVGKTPMLGICLGHQALIQHFGGTIGRAPEIVHGKSSNIEHNQTGAFKDIASPLPVARYHSLVATKMADELELTAYFTNVDGEKLPMAIEHQQAAIIGFQFHPESILTTYGSNLLAQSIEQLLFLSSQNLASDEQGNSHV